MLLFSFRSFTPAVASCFLFALLHVPRTVRCISMLANHTVVMPDFKIDSLNALLAMLDLNIVKHSNSNHLACHIDSLVLKRIVFVALTGIPESYCFYCCLE